jgi:hypothetical protein
MFDLMELAKMVTTVTINISPLTNAAPSLPTYHAQPCPPVPLRPLRSGVSLRERMLISLLYEAGVSALPWSPREQPDAVPQAYI